MSLASLEAKRTLIRAACFEHKHSGSNIPRNLFFSNVKCLRRRHTVISYMRVLRNTIANSLKKKWRARHINTDIVDDLKWTGRERGKHCFQSHLTTKHEDVRRQIGLYEIGGRKPLFFDEETTVWQRVGRPLFRYEPCVLIQSKYVFK
jgi:hypothetical protein